MREHSVLGCGEWYDELHGVMIRWYDEREPWLVRHEVFHGPNRQKSIPFEEYLQAVSQRRAMEHYGWSVEDFIQRFGRSYV